MNSHTEDKKQQAAHHNDDKINAPKVDNAMYKSYDNAEKSKKEHNSDMEKNEKDAHASKVVNETHVQKNESHQ